MKFFSNLSLGFASGSLGGLVNALVLWFLVYFGVTQSVGIHFDLPGSLQGKEMMIYHQMVWGGIWGFLLLLPFLKDRWFVRGLLLSLLPTLVVLFYLFPYRLGAGMCGIDHGSLTFVLVLIVNAFWGVTASAWYQSIRN